MTQKEYIKKCLELYKETENFSKEDFLNAHSSLVLDTLEVLVKGDGVSKEEGREILDQYMDQWLNELSEIAA